MNQKKSYSHLEIRLETLEALWIQHSGFLDKITKESGVNYYYQQSWIVLEGNPNYCENAAQRIYSKVYEDFIMQIEQFRSNDEMKPFYQLFQNPQYRELSKGIQGFWIYSAQSLMKQYLNMELKGYQSRFPELPQYFLITWFPKIQMLYIQQLVFQMIGFRYTQQGLNQKFKFDGQYNVTALEAISIYLNLDLDSIINQYSLQIELNQIPNQFYLVIKANNKNSITETCRILENYLERKNFWSIAYLQIKLSSKDIYYLKKNLNDQIRSNSTINIYSYEEMIQESKRLDQQFYINLTEIIIQRHSPDSLFVFGDADKQGEITDTIIQIVRKLKQNNRIEQEDRLSQQFTYKENSNQQFLWNPQVNQQISIPFQNNSKNYYQDYNQKQFDQRPVHQLFGTSLNDQQTNPYEYTKQNQTINDQQTNPYYYTKQIQTSEPFWNDDQPDRPLKNYKKYQKNYDNNWSQSKNYNQKRYKQRQRDQDFQELDVTLYVPKVPQNNQNNSVFSSPQQQEEEKSSQLLIVEELNKVIKCQIIKIELFSYQIIYTQNHYKNSQKINFQEFKLSFEDFMKKYYNLQAEITLVFNIENIIINVNFKQQEDIHQVKNVFHKYFLQQMYYVTQYSTQALGLVNILKVNSNVQYFSTKTELTGFLNEDQFSELVEIQDGQQMAIKVSNFSYRNHNQLREKFNNFEISQSFQQNSSVLDISRQVGQGKKVILISEDQLQYLNQEFVDLEACQLKKFKEFFKLPFYFVQIEYIEELLEQARVEFRRMNEKYVKAQVQAKEKENNKVWMKEIKKDQLCQAFKLYCYNMMEAFYMNLLNDLNESLMCTEEYQSNQYQSMYHEVIIDLGKRELNPRDPQSVEDLLFNSDFKFEPKDSNFFIDLPLGTFITVWVRNQKDILTEFQQIKKNEILPRIYPKIMICQIIAQHETLIYQMDISRKYKKFKHKIIK
ncbi:unnamed protein product [Paramecium octaurelia]|uniref:Uncharacterized protein n=1 Tax=Paramecium octaurelia TaxID=43137 RepID=A0A8S1TZR1_PAROT|nr:unnamed protein product [Paramecium octaurelia]